MEVCDRLDLWSRVKTAKEVLNNEGFSSKYRSPPGSPTGNVTGKRSQHKFESDGTRVTEVKDIPEPENGVAPDPQTQNTEIENSKPVSNEPAMSSMSTVNLASDSPSMAPNKPLNNPRNLNLISAPSPSTSISKPSTITKRPYKPVIPFTREEAIARAKAAVNHHNSELLVKTRRELSAASVTLARAPAPTSVTSEGNPKPQQSSLESYLASDPSKSAKQPESPHSLVRNGPKLRLRPVIPLQLPRPQKVVISHSPRFPSPLAKELTAATAISPAASCQTPETNKLSQVAFIVAGTQATAKMLSSNGSDTVLRPPVGGYRKDKKPERGGLVAPKALHHTQKNPEPLPCTRIDKLKEVNSDGSHPSDPGREDQHTGVTIPKENRRDYQLGDEDDKEELERLRKEILVKAHMGGLGNDDQTASPELLNKCRNGPWTQLLSPEYQELAKIRAVPQDNTPDYSGLPATLDLFSTTEVDKSPEQLRGERDSRLKACQQVYDKSPRIYPVVTGETFGLSPIPSEDHERALRIINASQGLAKSTNPQKTALNLARSARKKRTVQEHAWSDRYIVYWEYCPPAHADPDLYHARFQSWLDDTIPSDAPPIPPKDTIKSDIPILPTKRIVDTYHEAFFHGTAHADGENFMFILDMRKYDSPLDLTHKQTQSHAHETAAGYACNFTALKRKAEEDEHHRKEMDRKVRLEALNSPRLRSPGSPVANIYLRPVEVKDVLELQDIYNWYARNSTRSPYASLGSDQIQERIEGCRKAQLPFIIAVDRRSASSKRPERILGYALAKEFDNAYACRYTAELELFVKDGQTNQGIGKCLLDKLLEVCDPLYCPNGGYEFQARTDDRSAYYPGGRRRLARLVFTLSYADNDEITDHKRVKRWLEEHAGFEEQGVLRGVRVKGTNLVNVAYLVRSTGHSGTNKWEP